MARRRKVGNLLGLTLLALLAPGAPMHPYEMVGVLRKTGKDQDLPIKWGSVYTVVQNLEKHGFIEVTGSERAGRRPERTRYAITPAGRAELNDWLRDLVGTPEPEHPRFRAALSVLGVLPPGEAAELLRQRVRLLDARVGAERAALAEETVPRLFLVEAEYGLALLEAESRWVSGLLDEIESGDLPGLAEWRQFHEQGQAMPGWSELIELIEEATETPDRDD